MSFRSLLDLPLSLFNGLITKFKKSETLGTALVVSDNADGYTIFRGYGKIPGTVSLVPVSSGTPYTSIHYHEYITLSGTTAREVLAMQGSSLVGVVENTVPTVKQSGLVSERLAAISLSDKFFFTSTSNDPLKYDGNAVTNWGIFPPGEQETIIHPINNTVGWTTSGTNNSISNSVISKDALGSLQINKGDTTTPFITATTVSGAYNLANSGDSVHYWIFIPPQVYTIASTTSPCLELVLGSGIPPFWASKTYRTSQGDLTEGWNFITKKLTIPDATDNTLSLSSVADIGFRFHTTAAGNTFTGLLVDKLYVTDDGFPTTATGGNGLVSGTVSYGLTFTSKFGQTSNLGVTSTGVLAVNSKVNLTNLATSTDPQIVGRDIWRDLDGDAQYRYVASINDNTTTTYEDNIPRTALSTNTPPLAGDDIDDNSRPPKMLSLVVWNNHVFGINSIQKNQLEIAVASEAESWPLVNTKTFDRELTAIKEHSDGLFIFSSDKTWVLTGSTLDNFNVLEQNPDIGCSGPEALVNVKGEIIAWHDGGPYLWLSSRLTTQKIPWFIGNPIKNIIEALDPRSFSNIRVRHDRARLRVLFEIQSQYNGKYDMLLSFNYGHAHSGKVAVEGSVDPHDMREGTWSKVLLPASVNPISSSQVEQDADSPEVWIGTDDGNIYQLQAPGVFRYAQDPVLGASGIACTIKTQIFPLSPAADQEGKARYLTLNNTSVSSGTLSITYETHTGETGGVLTTTGIAIPYVAGESSHVIAIPQQGRHGSFGQLTFSNSAIDEDFFLSDVRLKILPNRFRGLRT